MMNRKQLEVEIERQHLAVAKANGWFVEKIERTGRGGFPDRFYAKQGRVVLLEWKRPGGILSKQQVLRHAELKAAGVEVRTVYSLAEAELVLHMDNKPGAAKDTCALDKESPGWRARTGVPLGRGG